MPRSDSLRSSGGSITSDEEGAPAPVAVTTSHQPLHSPVTATVQPGSATDRFRQTVFKVCYIYIAASWLGATMTVLTQCSISLDGDEPYR